MPRSAGSAPGQQSFQPLASTASRAVLPSGTSSAHSSTSRGRGEKETVTRAKSAKANYSSGARMTRVDDKGQTVYIDDNERAAEIRRMDEVIARDCT